MNLEISRSGARRRDLDDEAKRALCGELLNEIIGLTGRRCQKQPNVEYRVDLRIPVIPQEPSDGLPKILQIHGFDASRVLKAVQHSRIRSAKIYSAS